MFHLTFAILLLITIPTAFNQLITFKDGNVGVNFAGYHASAGLGGLLTGDAAHGGLQASAGTPFGQTAGAGLGGTVNNGRARGGAYAGASAGYGVGSSAAIGGDTDEFGARGGIGSEAHANGISTKTVKLSQTPQQQPQIQHQATFIKEKAIVNTVDVPNIDQRSSFAQDIPAAPAVQQLPPVQYNKSFQKRKFISRNNGRRNKIVERRVEVAAPQRYIQTYQQPANNFDYRKFFDFGFFSNLGATYGGAPQPSNNGHVINVQKQLSPNTLLLHKTVIPASQPQQVQTEQRFGDDDNSNEEIIEVKEISNPASAGVATTTYQATSHWQPNPNFFNDIFNIPISTLSAVNQFLNNKVANGGVSVTKTKTVEVGNT